MESNTYMQEITVITKKVDFEKKQLVKEEIKTVVASTKSQNNFIDELKKKDFIINEIKVKEFYIDRQGLLKAVNDYIDTLKLEQGQAVKEHIANVLKNGCLFKPVKK